MTNKRPSGRVNIDVPYTIGTKVFEKHYESKARVVGIELYINEQYDASVIYLVKLDGGATIKCSGDQIRRLTDEA